MTKLGDLTQSVKGLGSRVFDKVWSDNPQTKLFAMSIHVFYKLLALSWDPSDFTYVQKSGEGALRLMGVAKSGTEQLWRKGIEETTVAKNWIFRELVHINQWLEKL